MIHELQRILRNMPYTDMLLIASVLDKSFHAQSSKNPTQQEIAQVLASFALNPMKDRTDISKVEQDALRKVFSRSRNITVTRLQKNSGNGWQVSLSGQYQASIVNADLKVALDNLLDTVAATAALKG